MIWGETGTREGATAYQAASVGWLFSRYGITVLHVGDCIGTDKQLYHLGRAFGAHIEIHPPTIYKFRAFVGDNEDHWWPEREYHERDRDLVDAGTALVACPKEAVHGDPPQLPGGTGYTVKYARSLTMPIAIVWPNGHISYENWNLEMS